MKSNVVDKPYQPLLFELATMFPLKPDKRNRIVVPTVTGWTQCAEKYELDKAHRKLFHKIVEKDGYTFCFFKTDNYFFRDVIDLCCNIYYRAPNLEAEQRLLDFERCHWGNIPKSPLYDIFSKAEIKHLNKMAKEVIGDEVKRLRAELGI